MRTTIIWGLVGFVDVTICEIVETSNGVALGLRMGNELILAELWPTVEEAAMRASALRARLNARGWVAYDA